MYAASVACVCVFSWNLCLCVPFILSVSCDNSSSLFHMVTVFMWSQFQMITVSNGHSFHVVAVSHGHRFICGLIYCLVMSSSLRAFIPCIYLLNKIDQISVEVSPILLPCSPHCSEPLIVDSPK